MRRVRAKYVTGLTATPVRKDGHHPIIYMQCGPIRFNVSVRSRLTRVRSNTGSFRARRRDMDQRDRPKIQELYALLSPMPRGMNRSSATLWPQSEAGGPRWCCPEGPSILIGFASGCANTATGFFSSKAALRGKNAPASCRNLRLEDKPRVIVATGSYIGEGFDDSRLDTLFLAMPISWHGTLQQYVGPAAPSPRR